LCMGVASRDCEGFACPGGLQGTRTADGIPRGNVRARDGRNDPPHRYARLIEGGTADLAAELS